MSKDELNSVIFTITQSILAVVVVIGTGIFLNANPESTATVGVVGFCGVVLTFYFGQAIYNNATNNTIRAQNSQSASIQASK